MSDRQWRVMWLVIGGAACGVGAMVVAALGRGVRGAIGASALAFGCFLMWSLASEEGR